MPRRDRKRKTIRGPRKQQSTGAGRTSGRPFATGVLLIHGIGNQKPGQLTTTWGDSIRVGLADVLDLDPQRVGVRDPMPEERAPEHARVLEFTDQEGRQHDVLLTESVWSRTFQRPRASTLMWLVRSLPALFFTLGFDQRDRGQFERLKGGDVGSAGMGRFAHRAAVLVGLLGISGIAVLRFPGPSLLVLLIAALMLVLWPPANIIGHVQVAAAGRNAFDQIRGHVAGDLDRAHALVDELVVVAHSQGGYIAHTLLADGSYPRVRRFIGVGSGLKPITLLREFQDTQLIRAQWLAVGGVIAFEFGVLQLSELVLPADKSILLALLASALVSNMLLVPDLKTFLSLRLLPETSWVHTAAAVSTMGLAIYLLWQAMSLLGNRPESSIRRLGRRTAWFELSSPQDLVGRSLLPELPDGVEKSVPVLGHPLLDHVGYFAPKGLSARVISTHVVATLPGRPKTRHGFTDLVERAQAFSHRVTTLRHYFVIGFVLSVMAPILLFTPAGGGAVLLVACVLMAVVSAASSVPVIWRHRVAIPRLITDWKTGRLRPLPSEALTALGRPSRLHLAVAGVGLLTTVCSTMTGLFPFMFTPSLTALGGATVAAACILAAGYPPHAPIALTLVGLGQLRLVLDAPSVIPTAIYPLGQGGFALALACVIGTAAITIRAVALAARRRKSARVGAG